MRRVVVTGMGMVSPLGNGVETTWSNILAGKSGAKNPTGFETDDLACRVACQLPFGDGTNGTFNPDDVLPVKEQRKIDPFIVYAIAAADEALADANWKPESYEDQISSGVMIGSGIGGLLGIEKAAYDLQKKVLVASAHSLYPDASSTWHRVMSPSAMASRAPIMRLLLHAPLGRMLLAMRRVWFPLAMLT